MSTAYPLLVSYVIVALNQTVNEMILDNKTCENGLKNSNNKTVDNYFCLFTIPQLDQTSKSIVNDYISRFYSNYQYGNPVISWRVLQYNEAGFIDEHVDKRRPVKNHYHIATEIYLPPYNEIYFSGGELIVWNGNRIQSIKPHDTHWTHIILPLGMKHKVNRVIKGVRVSYTKSVYMKAKPKPKSKSKSIPETVSSQTKAIQTEL